jgi:hypothetical protein
MGNGNWEQERESEASFKDFNIYFLSDVEKVKK